MKIRLNKHLSLVVGIFLLAGFSSCIKNKAYNNETDFSNLQDHVTIVKGGLTNYNQAGVLFNGADTANVTLIVNLASKDLPSSPVKVTIGVDAAKIAAYNSANGTSFQAPPTNAYKIGSTVLTIPAGQQYAQTTVSFYAPALDPTISYMLPISITDASGKALTSNTNTIYYHIIGNPIAGTYNAYLSRWVGTDSTGAVLSYHNLDYGPVTFAPSSPTEVSTDGAFGDALLIDFTNNNGVLSNFKASFSAVPSGVVWGPDIQVITADPAHGYYRLGFTYVNSVGPRYVIYQFVKQ